MAGKIGLAAKLFLGTTMLAGGGAGAWYVTENGWPSIEKLVPIAATVQLEAEETVKTSGATESAADLDAVASAWSETTPAAGAAAEDSSPTARSADATLAHAEKATPQPQVADRYALATPATAASDATVSHTHSTLQSDPPIDGQRKPDESANETAETEPSASEDDESTEEPAQAVARGQEPKESEPDQFADLATDDTQLQPLKPSTARSSAASADRARDAFRSETTAAAGDRYGAGTPSATTASDAGGSSIVNPFSSRSASNSPASSTRDANTIEPLPAPPGEIGGRLADIPPAVDDSPDRRPNPFARASDSDSIGSLRSGRSIEPFDNTKISEPGGAGAGLRNERMGQESAGDGTGRPGERALEGPQRPALEIQKFAPGEIQVGKPAKFVVQVRNVGTQAAEEVTIRDEVPHGTRLVSSQPTAQTEGNYVVWQLGKLSPGEDRAVEMQLMPTEEGEVGSVATVSYSAQASVKTKCTEPQLAIRMTAPNKVMIGQQQRVKIELRNPGSGDATGVMLLENVPQGLKHAAGPALEFEIGTLRAGETRELELVLLAEKAGKIVNVLNARADGNLQVQQQVEFEVIAPGLTIDLNGPERRYLERPATYEVSVNNPGTAPAHDVQIVTKLPKGMRFVRANNMGEYDAATHAVYWSLAELPEGESGTVELVAMPVEAGPQTLEVESKTGEGLSDQTQRQILVDGLAAIMFEVRDLEDPIEVGGETGYEIRVVNQGTKAATNLQIAISLPPGLQLVSAEGETQHSEQRGAIVFEPLPQLAAKADTVFRVRAQGIAAGDQRVMVEVNTDDLAQPIRREESTRVFGDE
jgi:uncharacterized repeat protein (TIGR01451 family)